MDHHRPRRIAELVHGAVKSWRRAACQPGQGAGRDSCDDCAGGVDAAAVGKLDTRGLATLMQYTPDRSPGLYPAAARLDCRDQRARHGIRATLADHHAEGLPRHPFQVGEHRPARDIGRKVEVHSPSPQHGTDMRMLERLFQPGAGRGQQEPPEIKRSADALGTKCFEHEICKRTKLHRRAEKTEEMRCLGSERAT